MRKKLTISVLSILISLVLSGSLWAQSDTLEVYPTQNDDVVFLNDVFADNPGYKVYKLMSTEISYFYTQLTTISTDFEIYGQIDSQTGRLPVIQPLELDDGSIADRLFNATADNITIKFKNIFFLARTNANTIAPPPVPGSGDPDPGVISTNGNNLTLIVDNCVFDSWHHFSIYDNGSNNNFTITNNIFRNFVQKGNHLWVGEVYRHLNPNTPTGDILMQNNTMINVGAYAACTHTLHALNNSLVFDHNTVVYTTKNPFYNFYSTNVKVTNNIFYGTFAAGQSQGSYNGGWDDSDKKTVGAIISFDTLSTKIDSLFAPELLNEANSKQKIESKRNIIVKNNVYYWPKPLTDFWTAFNDTASEANKRYWPVWMNDRTKNMFDNNDMWAGFDESGNLEADPGYNQEIVDITTTGGFNAYLHNAFVSTGRSETAEYGIGINEPSGELDWQPEWPVKENLTYSNTSLKTASTHGFPVGDLNWFPDEKAQWLVTGVEEVSHNEAVPSEYTLKQNYPNPFNPSTKIEYSLPESGKISLTVFNLLGQAVEVLVDEVKPAGTHTIQFNAENLSSGIYFYRLRTSKTVLTNKMMLMK